MGGGLVTHIADELLSAVERVRFRHARIYVTEQSSAGRTCGQSNSANDLNDICRQQ